MVDHNQHSASGAGQLLRVLGPVRATALVVGSIIGTGVFIKPASMAEALGSASLVLLAWIAAGLLSLAGALTYAELGARHPRAGGEYVYIKEAYGPLPAFLFGWMRFWIGSPGSIAAFGVGSATFLAAVAPVEQDFPGGIAGLAVTLVVALTLVNLLTVSLSSGFQTFLTILKVLAVIGLAIVLFVAGREPSDVVPLGPHPLPATDAAGPGFAAFMVAVLAALWAFDGWNNMPMVAGEVKRPERNIPLALVIGMALVATLYLFADRAYFSVLTVEEIAALAQKGAPPVATVALQTALTDHGGEVAVRFMSLVFVVSALGAMTGSILTGARVPYAMAADGLFHRSFARLSGARVPAVSVAVQGAVAAILAASGTFDQLTNAVVFASWIFYGMCAGALFVLRRREARALGAGGAARAGYRVPLYPALPVVFIAVAAVLLVVTVIEMPLLSAIGLGVIALGVPIYAWLVRGAAKSAASSAGGTTSS